MDIRDIKDDEIPQLVEGDNIFFKIWDLQVKLVEGYQKVEGLPDYPISLNTRKNQNMIKDFIGRVVEELAEAYEAYHIHGNMDLWKEELIDALHFLMEIFIYVWGDKEKAIEGCLQKDLCQVLVGDVMPGESDEAPYWNVVFHLNMARNHLRNKDWKQTQVLPKEDDFYRELHRSIYALNWIFSRYQIAPEEIWITYCKKNLINWFRINSKY